MLFSKLISLVVVFLVMDFKMSRCSNIRGTSLPIGNMSLLSGNRTSRTLYGLLGLLAGYHPLAPAQLDTDYGQDVITKHFWPKLHVLQQKYPLLFAPSLPPPHPLPPPPTQPFPSIWYPPFIVIPVGNNPVNQQQIVNLHEPLTSDNSLNDNYQELQENNIQTINNNIQPIKDPIIKQNNNPKLNSLKSLVKLQKDIKQEGKLEENVEEIELSNVSESTSQTTVTLNETKEISEQTMPTKSVTTDLLQTKSTELNKVSTSTSESTSESTTISSNLPSTLPTVTQNITFSNNSGPYYYYKPEGSRLDVDNIRITSAPYDSGDLTRLPNYNEFSNDLTSYFTSYDNDHSEYKIRYTDKRNQQFYPMGGNFFDTQAYPIPNNLKYNHIMQKDDDFMPIYNKNNI